MQWRFCSLRRWIRMFRRIFSWGIGWDSQAIRGNRYPNKTWWRIHPKARKILYITITIFVILQVKKGYKLSQSRWQETTAVPDRKSAAANHQSSQWSKKCVPKPQASAVCETSALLKRYPNTNHNRNQFITKQVVIYCPIKLVPASKTRVHNRRNQQRM